MKLRILKDTTVNDQPAKKGDIIEVSDADYQTKYHYRFSEIEIVEATFDKSALDLAEEHAKRVGPNDPSHPAYNAYTGVVGRPSPRLADETDEAYSKRTARKSGETDTAYATRVPRPGALPSDHPGEHSTGESESVHTAKGSSTTSKHS